MPVSRPQRRIACSCLTAVTLVVGGIALPLAGAIAASPSPAHAAGDCLSCGEERYDGEPPSVLYRVSRQPPSEVFSRGFAPSGRDMDLLRHTIGGSYNAASGYVATTASIASAARIANTMLQGRERVWIYEIRAESYMYNVEQSLDRLERLARNRAGGSRDPRDRCAWTQHADRIQAVIARYAHQEEWVATAAIRPANIHFAWEVDHTLPPTLQALDALAAIPQEPGVFRHGTTRASDRLIGTLPKEPDLGPIDAVPPGQGPSGSNGG